jgi:hypothetical protein
MVKISFQRSYIEKTHLRPMRSTARFPSNPFQRREPSVVLNGVAIWSVHDDIDETGVSTKSRRQVYVIGSNEPDFDRKVDKQLGMLV